MFKIAREDLERSGITVQEAEQAELYSVKDASKEHPDFKDLPGLIIPYIDPWTDNYMQYELKGKSHDFCRVRYFPPENKVHSFTTKKSMRYSQPRDSGVHPYFPMTEDINWCEVAEDIEVPIIITEGEKKAIAGCLAGVPTIGLGGVYNFMADGDMLTHLSKIMWQGRTVYICYDSDAEENAAIRIAEGRLATELSLKRRANVFMVRLPPLPGGKKCGLDDFLVDRGDEALYKALRAAPEMRRIDKEVIKLNDKVAWIESEGKVLDLTTNVFMSKSDFTLGSQYSTATIEIPIDRTKVKVISVSEAWLKHSYATRYTDTVFRPGLAAKSIPLPNRGGIAYNRFRGLSGIEGDVTPFFTLYDYLMSETTELDLDLVWMTTCYKIQNLGARIDLGLMFLGKQGSGKSLLCKIISEMVKPYDKTIASNELGADFNGWIESSLMVVVNEATTYQLRFNMAKVKTYITDKTQTMNEKYRATRQVESHGFYMFNSNEENAGAFDDDDRRMIIVGCPERHPDGDKFYDPIGDWYEDDGPKKLLHFFQNYDLKGWKPPSVAPQTRAKRMAYYASLTPVQRVGHQMLEGNENVVIQWIAAALNWAASDAVTPATAQLASDISMTLSHLQVRPFYTPDELLRLLPVVAGTLNMGKIRVSEANLLAQELVQQGIRWLHCTDSMDGFWHEGQTRQYLVISDFADFRAPLTQKAFTEYMKNFPTYNEYLAAQKQVAAEQKRKRRRGSQRNKTT